MYSDYTARCTLTTLLSGLHWLVYYTARCTSIAVRDNKPMDVGTSPARGSPLGFQPSEPPQRRQRVLHATFGHPDLFGKLASGTPCALIPLVFRVEVHVPAQAGGNNLLPRRQIRSEHGTP